ARQEVKTEKTQLGDEQIEADLPIKGEAEGPSEGASADPTGHAEEGSQRPGLDVHQDVGDGVDEGEEEAEVKEEPPAGEEALGLLLDELANGGGKVEEDGGGEEDGPEERMWIRMLTLLLRYAT
ncbi:hypothetical protein CRG98_040087, partial [Punica granatum]